VVQEQSHHIQQLEAEVTQANTRLGAAAQFDARLTHLKEEMLQLIKRRTRGAEPPTLSAGNSMVMKQLDNQATALNHLRREVAKTDRFDEQILLARTESGRVNQEVNKLRAQMDEIRRLLDERTNPITFLEEQRRTDVRKLAELQGELPELRKKIEGNTSKVQVVSQQVPQFAKYEAALDSMRGEIRSHREHLDFQLAQRERQLKDWTALAEDTERRIREIESSMEKYTEFYQLNKRSLTSLQDFQERLQRDQHRFGELQRLNEDRQRTAIEKFQAEFEQRWQKQAMEMQPQFVGFQKSVESLQKRLEELVKLHDTIDSQLNLVLQIIEEDIQNRAVAATGWQRRFEEIAEG